MDAELISEIPRDFWEGRVPVLRGKIIPIQRTIHPDYSVGPEQTGEILRDLWEAQERICNNLRKHLRAIHKAKCLQEWDNPWE